MKLNEKILYCRKKAGLSQEALAERIGVSRQAISKWETGEASPEITKLPLLAAAFGVTADWLLSEDEPADEPLPAEESAPDSAPQSFPCEPAAGAWPAWVDKLPDFLARLIRTYGWLVGLRMAIGGALFAALGFVGKAMFGAMNDYAAGQMGSVMGGLGGGVTLYDNAGNVLDPASLGLTTADLNAMGLGSSSGWSYSGLTASASLPEPIAILCNLIIVIGLVLLIGGALLAWYLKKRGQEAA